MSNIKIETTEEHLFEIKDEQTFCKILIEREMHHENNDRISLYISNNVSSCAHVYHLETEQVDSLIRSLREMLTFLNR